ncbi:MAG TPA: right-handed parallel beta-helix repeat-containing protein [Terriglobia bacterium]|nr:right-handed parallel beta-helix repeat-containing protein [Terriglobia bacterium]
MNEIRRCSDELGRVQERRSARAELFWVWAAGSPARHAASERAARLGQTVRALLAALAFCLAAESLQAEQHTGVLLPDGTEFVSWEQPLRFTKTYYVDNRNPRASDSNPGTQDLPFATINRAAQLLKPGERVVIMTGIYRERIDPARGGTGPDEMISYEAAPGANVVVKGSRLVKAGWEPSVEYKLGPHPPDRSSLKIFERRLDDLDFRGYNPFGMVNIMQYRTYLMPKPEELKQHLLRRGMVFVDGQRLDQVESYDELVHKPEGAFWCEHDGLTIHLRLPGDADPSQHDVELAIQEQVFAPTKRGLGYIRVRGITFEHGANAFPVPQRGLVSASRGHHWIIEDCVIRHANGVALDIGAQDWAMELPDPVGYSIVRRNHIDDAGVCGLAGMGVQNTLIEGNLIEHVGYQDVELGWETGGIKCHVTKNCLIRNNVIRHTIHAEAIWLDYQNSNTRVTSNVLGDNLQTLRGGIYLEASQYPNMIDDNIIWKATVGHGGGSYNMPAHGGWGITVDGSDETVIAHNLIGMTEDAGIKFRGIEGRIVGPRGGTARRNKVIGNIFYRCGKAIEFANPDNSADYNLFTPDWGAVTDETQGVGRGLNWLTSTKEPLMLDLEAWQKFLGFDKHSAYGDMKIDVDLDALAMTWSVGGSISQVPTDTHFRRDLLGEVAGDARKPGPLVNLPSSSTRVAIDPRGFQ